jgi:hypothetical protein
MKSNLLLLLFTFACLLVNAQVQDKSFEINILEVNSKQSYRLPLTQKFSSLMVRINSLSSFENSFLVVNADTIWLKSNHHHDGNGLLGSELVLFRFPTDDIIFYSSEITGKIEVHFYYAPTLEINTIQNRTSAPICDEPLSTSQITWRTGLSNPIGVRSSTPTTHVIIHHSADANTVLADYTSLVRNIYLLHTKTNGWDDIGYNYLIAPDGTIFKGRDPQGLARQDNVQGAHMCNKNENTMGICMLGTFTSTLPTRAALLSLYQLVGWKVTRDNINPLGSTMHAIGPTGSGVPNTLIPNVAGHRDGCSSGYTDCPGTTFYNSFVSLRDSVSMYANRCNITSIDTALPDAFKFISLGNHVYPVPAKNYTKVKVYSYDGKNIIEAPFSSELATFKLPRNQVLIAILLTADGEVYQFKILLDL